MTNSDADPGRDRRWFSPEELADMSRPTMDKAIEAIDAGDYQRARDLCDGMRHEWRFLHDLLVQMVAGLITFVQEHSGEDAIEQAWTAMSERAWKNDVGQIMQRDRRKIVEALAATWRAHSLSGTGHNPAAFTVTEDDEKFTFEMNPCGSGQRLWRNGGYEGSGGFGLTERAHSWSYDRAEFPLYCTHCTFMNELLPIKWYGLPIYPSDPPENFDTDPCVWYWYKDPADIPDRHWERYGERRPTA